MNKKNTIQKEKKYFNNNFSNLYFSPTKVSFFSLFKFKSFYLIQNKMSLGHNSLKLQKSWHNNLSKCFLGARNKTIIFNYKFTLDYLIKALYIFTAVLKFNGNVLIVNTNPELSKLIYHMKKNTNSSSLFFSDCGWTKGSLTNWSMHYNKIKTFITFYHGFDVFLNENNIHFPNYKKMKKSYKGFIVNNKSTKKKNTYNKNVSNEKENLSFNNLSNTENYDTKSHTLKFNLKWKPDLVILISTDNTESIIKEAYSLNIPTIAFLDSNSTTSSITYPIPTNTYYYYFVWFFSTLITKLSNKYSNSQFK